MTYDIFEEPLDCFIIVMKSDSTIIFPKSKNRHTNDFGFIDSRRYGNCGAGILIAKRKNHKLQILSVCDNK